MKKFIAGFVVFWVVVLTVIVVASTYQYDVVFVLPDNMSESVKARYNEKVDLLDYDSTTYEIVAWYYDEGLTMEFNPESKVTGDVMLYAKVRSKIKYTVFLDSYDGRRDENLLLEVRHSEVIGVLNFNIEKPGHKLIGWYLEEQFINEFDLLNTKVTEDLHLYAKWEKDVYTIRFVDDNSNVLKTLTNIGYGTTINEDDIPIPPTKNGHTFIGWDKDLTAIKEAGTIKALYSVNKYSIRMHNNGVVTNEDVDYNSIIKLPILEREGYNFLGWYMLNEGVESPVIDRMPDNEINVYAKWEIKKYTVVFQDDQGTELSRQVIEHGNVTSEVLAPIVTGYDFVSWDKDLLNIKGNIITKPIYQVKNYTLYYDDNIRTVSYNALLQMTNPEKTGHKFEGWYYDNNSVEQRVTNQTRMPDNDFIVYSKWEKNTYVVNFLFNGQVIETQNVKYLESAIELSNEKISKPGYLFLRYDKNLTNITGNTDINLLYSEISHAVTFNNNGEIETRNIRESSNIVYPSVNRVGYTFLGWFYINDNNEEIKGPVIMPKNELALFAKWQINTFTIKFVVSNREDEIQVLNYGELPVMPKADEGKLIEWDKEITIATENKVYTGRMVSIKYQLTVLIDGTNDQTLMISAYEPLNLSRLIPNRENYEFVGWKLKSNDNDLESEIMPNENLTIYAVWRARFKLYIDDKSIVNNGIYEGTDISVYLNQAKVKEGHIFVAFYLDANYETLAPTEEIMPNREVRLFAKFDREVKTVIFMNGNEIIETVLVLYGDNAIAPSEVIPSLGYSFSAWDSELTNIRTDKTINALFTRNKYTLTLYLDDEVIETSVLDYGSTKSLVPPTVENMKFNGWYDANDNLVTRSSSYVIGASNMDLYARYIPINYYSVDFDARPIGIVSNSIEEGKPVNRPTNNPIREGYTFINWYKDLNNDILWQFTDPITENTVIYAKWQINTYEVRFLDYEGNLIGNVQNIEYQKSATAPILDERVGYEFVEWDTRYNNVTASINVKPIYRIREYTITYNADAGVHSNVQKIKITDVYELQEAQKNGYQFDGWYDDAIFTNKIETLENISNNVILYAKYTANQYQITFDTNGGSAISAKNTLYNQSVGILPKPTRVGYEFIRWNLNLEPYSNNTIYKELNNIQLVAEWKINSYLISFDVDGGTNVEGQIVDYGNKVNRPVTEKIHYDFDGWYLGNTLYDFESAVTNAFTLTARWIRLEFGIEYNIDEDVEHENTIYEFNSGTNYTLKDAKKDGYTFVGWFDQNNEQVTQIGSQENDLILTPKFELKVYELKFESEVQNFRHNNQKSSITVTEKYTLLPAEKEGYEFINWYVNGEIVTTIEGITSNVILIAVFEKITYVIRYESNVGNYNNPNLDKKEYQVGDPYVLLAASKNGYDFVGWQFEVSLIENLSNKIGDITLKAIFNIKTYNIIYITDGGVENPSNPSTFTVVSTTKLLPATKVGYTFLGWFLDNQLTIPFESFANHYDTLVLYAKYEITEYSITYELLPDETNDSRNVQKFNVNTNKEIYPATKKYHTFLGWEDSRGNRVSNTNQLGNGNVVLKAIFERNVASKKISYNLGDKTGGTNPSPTTFMVGEPIDLLSPFGYGYEFLGWYLTSTPTDEDVNITSTKEFTDDIELFAVFGTTPLVYTISYETDTSEIKEISEFSFNSNLSIANLTQPSDDVTNGERVKTFAGWYLDEERTIPFEYVTMPAQHLTLYAKWNATYHITIETTIDGYSINTISLMSDAIVNLPTPTRPELVFVGWYLDLEYTMEFVDEYMPPRDLVLFAKWEVRKVTITYVTNITDMPNIIDLTGEYNDLIPFNVEANNLVNKPYILTGWYLNSNLTTLIDFSTRILTTNITIYAKWDLPTTKPDITVDYNNGTDPLKPNLNWNATYNLQTLPTPQKEGFIFVRYDIYGSDGELIPQTTTLRIIDDYLIIAVYKITQVNVTLMDSSVVARRFNVDYGSSLSDALEREINRPQKPGYDVKSFYSNSELTEIYDQFQAIITNITIYIEYEPALYQVSFDTGLGTSMQTRFVSYNSTLNLADNEYSIREGYSISGFEINGQAININQYQIREAVTIKIVWSKVSYQFIFNDSGVETSVSYGYGELLARPPMYEYDEQKGYFAGWFLDSGFTELYVFDRYMEEGIIRIYAKWVKNISAQYYLYEDSEFHLILQQEKNANNKLTKPNIDRYGFEFENWYSNQNMTVVYDFNQDVTSGIPIKLYGRWIPITYEVKLNVEGEAPRTLIRAYHQTLNIPVPIKTGYQFKYWITNDGSIFTRTEMVARNIELTAVFETRNYMLRLEANTGIFTVNETVNGVNTLVQKQVVTFEVPYGATLNDIYNNVKIRKYAYLFDKWFELNSEFQLETMPNRNVTLRATYKLHFTPGLIFTLNQVDGEDVYFVTGYIGEAVNILIPDFMYDEDDRMLDVIQITSRAFMTNRLFETVTIGKNVRTIGREAFKNLKNLTRINMSPGSELRIIEEQAFFGANKLVDFNFPQSVEVIEADAFRSTRISKVLFEEDSRIREIGNYAFAYTRVNEVTFSNSLASIGQNAFRNTFITEFVLPKSIRTIGVNILTGNRSVIHMQVPNNQRLNYYFGSSNNNVPQTLLTVNVVDIGTNILVARFAEGLRVQRVTLESTISIINENAFNNNRELLSINLDNIETIGNLGFNNTSKLQMVDLSKLRTIGTSGFAYASLLRNIGDISNLQTIGASAFRNTQVEFLDLVATTSIGANAFVSMTSLREIIIYNTVQTISGNILSRTNNLQKITTPGRITLTSLFGGATNIPVSLKEVVIATGSATIVEAFARNARNIEKVTVPSSVTSMGIRAFYDATKLKEFDLSATRLTVIPQSTFYNNTSLTTVKLPYTIHTIGQWAFYNSGLREFEFTDTMKTIENYAFRYSKLREVNLTSSITSVGTNAFANMVELRVVTIPSTFTAASNTNIFLNSINIISLTAPSNATLSSFGFTRLPKIEYLEASYGSRIIANSWALNVSTYELIIPNTVETINASAFRGMKNLRYLDLSSTKITAIPSMMLQDASAIVEVKVPNVVKSIGSSAFRRSGLQIFAFPNALEDIEGHAFRESKLEKVILPDSVKNIRVAAFEYMDLLKEVRIPASATVYVSSNNNQNTYLFNQSRNIEKITVPGKYSLSYYYLNHTTKLQTVEISAGSTSIVNEFMNATNNANYRNATNIIIPNSITSIGNNAFRGVTNLTDVTVSNNLATIGNNAFDGTKLREFNFVNSLRTIGTSAFNNTLLESIRINDTIQTINSSAFANNTSLRDVYLPNANTIGSNLFTNTAIEKLELPGKVTLSSLGLGGSTSLREVTFLEGTTEIVGSFLFLTNTSTIGYPNLRTINIPESVVTIGVRSFFAYQGTSINLPSKLVSIGNDGFSNSNIQTITYTKDGNIIENTFPETLLNIGTYSFSLTNLTELSIPDVAIVIGNNAFNGIKSLRKINIPSKATVNTTILSNAMDNSFEKTLIVDGQKTLATLGLGVSISNLEVIILDGTATLPASFAQNYSGLTKITLPNSLLTFGNSSLEATGLTSITIPNSVTTIGNNVFRQTLIDELTIPNSVTRIGSRAFSSMNSLITISMPHHVTLDNVSSSNTNSLIFEGSNYITNLTIPGRYTAANLGLNPTESSVINLTVANGTTSIAASYMNNIAKLQKLVLPETVTNIGANAFNGTRIIDVVVPNKVANIGNLAFANNTEMQTFVMENGTAIVGTTILEGNNKVISLRVSGHKKLSEYYTLISTVESLTTVEIASGSTYVISEFALDYSYITKVVLPLSVSQIQSRAFKNTGLTTINLENITNYGIESFSNSKLRNVHISSVVTAVGLNAFSNNTNLYNVKVDNGYTGDANKMFSGSNRINTIEVPSGIPLEDFGITNQTHTLINNVTISNGSEIIVMNWLDGFSSVSNVIIPETIKIISVDAFKGTRIERLIIPISVIEIQPDALNIASLKEITFKRTTEGLTVHSNAFNQGLEKIIIPVGTRTMYNTILPQSVQLIIEEV